jgi:hypothetical protein
MACQQSVHQFSATQFAFRSLRSTFLDDQRRILWPANYKDEWGDMRIATTARV